jgi:YmaF family
MSRMDNCKCRRIRRHVHEVQGSTLITTENGQPHNHRFAGVTGDAIPINNGTDHIHKLETITDTFDEHHHCIKVWVGRAIPVGDGRHVHFVYAKTECADGHVHKFRVATLIDDPIGDSN